MGFWSGIFNRLQGITTYEPRQYKVGPTELVDLSGVSAAKLFKTQPHLRTVVTFLARNIAHLGVHSYVKQSDGGRLRDISSPVGGFLSGAKANESMTLYQLIYALVVDKALYDRAYWWPVVNQNGNWEVYRLPPSWVQTKSDNFGKVTHEVSFESDKKLTLDSSRVVYFGGYHPTDPGGCSATIVSLKEVLAEQIQASKYRQQLWARGGKVSAVLQRPVDAPRWTDSQRETFREDWYEKYTGSGKRAGGTPILEDGMTLNRVDFSATDQQYIEGVKLAYSTVANAFHVNPTMVGILDNANYSNVREFRKMLYGDTLGPLIAEIESTLNAFLIPIMGGAKGSYIEFNVAEKLQADFEQQAQWFQSAVGSAYMTRNEARARLNLPAIDGGDELITPLNVSVDPGGYSQNSGEVRVKSRGLRVDRRSWVKRYTTVLEAHARKRLYKSGRLKVKASADESLAEDLLDLDLGLTSEVGNKLLEGRDEDYDKGSTKSYLKKRAKRISQGIVDSLEDLEDEQAEWEEAMEGGDPPDTVEPVEHWLKESALGMAGSMVTWAMGWATQEAGRQSGAATKTWHTGPNARDSHAAMDGERVGLDEEFSNGMKYPGDDDDPAEVAHCNCVTSIDWE